MHLIGIVWSSGFETPLVNYLVALTVICGGSYGLAIIVLSVSSRLITMPLTLRTYHSTHRMKELQPQLAEIKKRHSDPAARARAQRELYAEAGINPLGCLGPQLLQIPLFIAVNRVVRITTSAGAPTSLPARLYNIPLLKHALPLHTRFLAFDLRTHGAVWLAVAVLLLMLLQQRISTFTSNSGGRGSAAIMAVGMSGLFASYVLRAPAALGIYWATSTFMGVAVQLVFLKRRGRSLQALLPALIGRGSPQLALAGGPTLALPAASEVSSDEPSRALESTSAPRRKRRKRRRR